MSLNILTIIPANKHNDVPIDATIVIETSEVVDPFTIANGISIYTESKAVRDNKDLVELDTKYSDILDIGEVNTQFPFKYQVSEKTITITPEISLLPDSTFFIDIFPGNDATRYLSKKTVGTPIIISSNGKVNINSSYTGASDDSYEITFSSSDGSTVDTIDVAKGIRHVGSFKFEPGKDFNIGDVAISLDGEWDIADSISIPVYKASGLSDVVRVEFTTSKYTTTIPRSNKIEYVSDTLDPFTVTKTVPENMSINNMTVNPIIIEFSKQLKADQDLADKIRIKRSSFEDGATKNINQYYKIEGNKLKIYMISTSRI